MTGCSNFGLVESAVEQFLIMEGSRQHLLREVYHQKAENEQGIM